MLGWMLAISQLGLGLRLYRTGMYRTHKWLFVYVLFGLARTGALMLSEPSKRPYLLIWLATEIPLQTLLLLIPLEWATRFIREFPGNETFERILKGPVLNVVMIVTAATIFFAEAVAMQWVDAPLGKFIQILLVSKSWVAAGGAAWIALICGHFWTIKRPVKKNLWTHASVLIPTLAAFSLAYGVGADAMMGGKGITPEMRRIAQVAPGWIFVVATWSWFVALRPSGEVTPEYNATSERRAEEADREIDHLLNAVRG